MKTFLSFVFLIIGISNLASAEFVPYTNERFTQAQKNNEKILVHFSADWCPTCRAQKESLAQLEKSGKLNGLTLLTADYDKDTEFKKQLKITHQSTLVSFYGNFETARATGQTSTDDLGQFVQSHLTALTLQDQLRMISESFAGKISPEKKKVMEDAVAQLKNSKLIEKSLKVGQKFPSFKLKDAEGKTVELSKVLKQGPAVISFYRGSWCPYCNAQLSEYQKHLADFQAHGGTLLAITPEKPELEATLKQGKKIEFEILNDKDNHLASKIGLVYGVTPELKSLYQEFGIDLEKTQGNPDWKLPVPATFVVGKDGKVTYAFVDVDYTKRAEVSDILKALDQTKK